MHIYKFGDRNKPVLLLLPGTCCHWKRNFGAVIPLLEPDFHVLCVSYDGFDESEQTIFPDMITETEKIEDYIKENFEGHIYAAYGCSLGGSFVGLLIQRGRVHIDHGILGSSDLDQSAPLSARIKAQLVSLILHGIFQKGSLPGWMQKRLDKKTKEEREYMDQMLEMFGIGNTDMAFVQKKSIRNQFYSDLVTPLENNISVSGTTVHCFYAVKMGEEYEVRYRQHFREPDIRRHDMQHEELLICHPEQWAMEVRRCCKIHRVEECEVCKELDYHEIIDCIMSALDARDAYTAGHSQRVSDMALEICSLIGLKEKDTQKIHIAAHLHDIGKIAIPDAVLFKESRLNDEEWEQIKKHPQIGAEILSKSHYLDELKEIVLHHHERYDGKGYPEGLKGVEIPMGARIVAICDSIDAMTSNRCYRKAHTLEYCYHEIENNLGKMYDPILGQYVLDNWERVTKIVSETANS